MARTSTIYARVEPEVKEQAEEILNMLGIPMSNAVDMFLRQVVMQKGIPFDMKIPVEKPIAFGSLTELEVRDELQKGLDDIKNHRYYAAESTEDDIRKMYDK